MALLNYTTSIDAVKTVAEIQSILARSGASAVMVEYNTGGIPSGIAFKIRTSAGPCSFTLPCDVRAIYRVLKDQADQGVVQKRFVNDEQAARVGWRIIKDWIEAQLALVQTGLATLEQVFLPYALTSGGGTVYQRYVGAGMAGLAIENSKR